MNIIFFSNYCMCKIYATVSILWSIKRSSASEVLCELVCVCVCVCVAAARPQCAKTPQTQRRGGPSQRWGNYTPAWLHGCVVYSDASQAGAHKDAVSRCTSQWVFLGPPVSQEAPL